MAPSTKNHKSISIALTGSGGAGVVTAGLMLLQAAANAGWYALLVRSAGPQIRGGEAASLIRLSSEPVEGQDDHFQILCALDWHNIERFAAEIPLTKDSLVISDPSDGEVPEVISSTGARLVSLPLKEMVKEIPKGRANMIALGVLAELIGLPDETMRETIGKVIAKKGEEALNASLSALTAGAEKAKELGPVTAPTPPSAEHQGRWAISGNEAAGVGAVRGGVRFVAAYPITPATELLEWLSPNLTELGGLLVQAEDELASINMIIGASYGGTPSLTATSGPGLALMMESIGLAVASEIPLVIVNVMRAGPSTGIPTKSEQSDLNIALFGLHGDAPHLVLAPSSISDCIFTTQWATHLAETLQTPAIVLSDQSLGQTRAVIDTPADVAFVSKRKIPSPIQEGYERYALDAVGVSAMSIPGVPSGQYTADGLEHSESGLPSSTVKDHLAQLNKRRNKLTGHDYGDHWAEIDGDGEIAIITWGSTTAPVREALHRIRNNGSDCRMISLRLLAPTQPKKLSDALKGVKRAMVVEQNHEGQLYHYLLGHYDLPCPIVSFHQPGPLPIRPGQVQARLAEWSEE